MILIATSDSTVLATCGSALKGNGTVIAASDPDHLCDTVKQLKPSLLLIDFYLIQPGYLRCIERIKLASPRTRILMLNVSAGDQIEMELLGYGVRGCCAPDASAEQVGRAAFALMAGEYWIRRSLMSRLLDAQLVNKRQDMPAVQDRCAPIAGLTERESEIALLVSQGNNNKRIARLLEITERTVKSHLTEIFRKTGVADRLSLALKITMVPAQADHDGPEAYCRTSQAAQEIDLHTMA